MDLLRRNAGLLAGYGLVAVAGAQFCYFSAVTHMQVGPALLIEYTAPAAVVVWLWLRHGQRPGPVTLVGAGAAALGLVLVLDLLSGADLACAGVALGAGRDGRRRDVLRRLRRRGQRASTDRPGRRWPGRRRPSALGGSASSGCCRAGDHVLGRVRRHHRGRWVPIVLLGVVTAGVAYMTGIAAIRRLGRGSRRSSR